jgi:hypothetical protein
LVLLQSVQDGLLEKVCALLDMVALE